MKYTLVNRKKSVNANCDEDFVTWMRKCDMQKWTDNRSFMEGYSHRKLLFEKIKLRTHSETAFVEDLKDNDLLIIEKGNRPKFLRLFVKE